MISEDIFIEGERKLGRYTIVILQPLDDGAWRPATMQLHGLITNYRIILQPFKKKYTPATLPSHYIRAVEIAQQGGHNCIELTLITNDKLYLMLGTGNLDDVLYDLRTMKAPPPKYKFDDNVAKTSIERLITYLKKANSPKI